MTAVVPSVHIYNRDTQLINKPGMASKIAVVGAFKTTETNPKLFKTVEEAQTSFGDDDTFNGCAVIEDLFVGASSLLCVNVSTKAGDVWTKTLNATNLATALAKIKGEDWDMLFVADTLTDSLLPVIDAYLDTTYEMKYPAGFVGVLAGASTSDNVTSAGLAGEHCYGLLTQQLTINGVSKSLLQSGAYYCGILAGMNVGNSMTMKVIPGVTAINPELSFETGGDGKTLLEAGITTVKCQDRTNNKYVVVNSEQPDGYDLYINRVRDYVVKQMSLHDFLGDPTNDITINGVKHELDRVKNQCVDVLGLCKDINYTVAKESTGCIGISIDSILFDGVLTRINVYVRLEVE